MTKAKMTAKKKPSAAEAAAAAVLSRPTLKIGTPNNQQFGSKNIKAPKPQPKPEPPKGKQAKVHPAVAERQHKEELAYRAKRWAELHASPKTREKMDTQLEGLSAADQRTVYLNGQRIAAGFAPKH